jgi:adenosylcobinamide kinase/adenosylcobinamide-phosphate guanylyltransferase
VGRLVLVTGGARSGKSRFAEEVALASGEPVVYLATMEAGDDELRARVAEHQRRRPDHWQTVEAPLGLAGAVRAINPGATVLVDCLGLWVTNELLALVPDPDTPGADFAPAVGSVVQAARETLELQGRRGGTMVAVTNEVGSGIVPMGALSRAFRDALGLVNQEFARAADEVHLLVSGIPVRIKP